MNNRTLELLAVSALIGECESIAEKGLLTEPAEQSLRLLIAHALSAFSMPSKHERAANNNRAADSELHTLLDYSYDEMIEVLRAQMEATL